MCDMVVIVRNVVDGERRRRSLEINKYRGSGHYKGEYPCTITPAASPIFPLDAKDRPGPHKAERYSSGFPGLDAMMHGGLFRDSIVIVRGPTGSGKTLLAGLYARAGALRGEKVVVLRIRGAEADPPAQLRRHRHADGRAGEGRQPADRLPLSRGDGPRRPAGDAAAWAWRSSSPRWSCMDSISSIEHSSSEKGFRQFMIGLASLLREHGRSALLTQTVVGREAATMTAPYLSTSPTPS